MTSALNTDTPITIQFPEGDVFGNPKPTVQTTWGQFVANITEDTVADVAEQIAADNYAEIGGGAAPVVWVFA